MRCALYARKSTAQNVVDNLTNPLMVILGHANLLQRTLPSDARATKHTDTILSEANRAGKIVRYVLDFARRREPIVNQFRSKSSSIALWR